jgi:hypothetical protein
VLGAERQRVLDAAYAANPQRWINGAPRVPMPPEVVTINPAPPLDLESCSPIANGVVPTELPVILPNRKEVFPT